MRWPARCGSAGYSRTWWPQRTAGARERRRIRAWPCPRHLTGKSRMHEALLVARSKSHRAVSTRAHASAMPQAGASLTNHPQHRSARKQGQLISRFAVPLLLAPPRNRSCTKFKHPTQGKLRRPFREIASALSTDSVDNSWTKLGHTLYRRSEGLLAANPKANFERGQRTQYLCGLREEDARKPAWMLDPETSQIARKTSGPHQRQKYRPALDRPPPDPQRSVSPWSH